MAFISALKFIAILIIYFMTIRAFMTLMDWIGSLIGLKWLISKGVDRFSKQ